MKPMFVAEIGCNHQGDFQLALRMVDAAARVGVNVVKFQKRDPDSLPDHIRNMPRKDMENSFGNTYYEHRWALEFTLEQHLVLKDRCLERGVDYALSVFDLPSARDAVEILKPYYIKIGSGVTHNRKLLEYVFLKWKNPVHISTGMMDQAESADIKRLCRKHQVKSVFYHCVSAYPTPYNQCCIQEIHNLCRDGWDVGFSNHSLGIALDAPAVALGARWIERHFTLDKELKGSDHSISLLPVEMKQTIQNCLHTYEALGMKNGSVQPCEESNRAFYRSWV